MNAKEMRMALEMAQDTSHSLAEVNDDVLFGCGCNDFKWPVTVPIEVIAKHLRWQCQFLFGGWDWQEYNDNCVPIMRQRIRLADVRESEWVRMRCDAVCEGLSK